MAIDDTIAARLRELANEANPAPEASRAVVDQLVARKRRRRAAVTVSVAAVILVLFAAMFTLRSGTEQLDTTTPSPAATVPRPVVVPGWMPDGFSIRTNVAVAAPGPDATIGTLPIAQVLVAGNGAKSSAAQQAVLVTQTRPNARGTEATRGDHQVDISGHVARAGGTSEGTGALLRYLWWQQDDLVMFLGGYGLSEADLIHMATTLTTTAARQDRGLTIEASRPSPCGPIVEGPGPPSHTRNADALPGKGYTSLENTLANQLVNLIGLVHPATDTGTATTLAWVHQPSWIEVVERGGNVYQSGPDGSLVVGPTPDDWEPAVLVPSSAQFPSTTIDGRPLPIRFFACSR